MKTLRKLAYAAILVLVLSAFRQDKVITIFMIGDSTMANKNIKNNNPERGWGMVLQCYFDDGVRVDNHAVNGRSSKSFIDEGRWQRVVERIRPGDYVFIQFGHNDEKPKPDRHTDPGSTFDANLRKFVEETREKGGIPVLFNSVVRRNFFKTAPANDDDENLRRTSAMTVVGQEETDTLYDTHGDYTKSPRDVAGETGAYFVDANKITHELEQGLGREKSKKLHMWFAAGEHPAIPKGRKDNTHYCVYGAHVVAEILAEAVGKEIPRLQKHLVNYDIAVATDGKGDFFSLQEAVNSVPDNKETTIQLFSGEWEKPNVAKGKDIRFILREGAVWKK